MLPTNILYRTFFIRACQYGTAFTLDVEGQEFLITAAHLLGEEPEAVELKVFLDGRWKALAYRIIGIGNGELDIAVLKTEERLSSAAYVVGAKFGDCHLGQDFFFVGFPFKMWVDYGPAIGSPAGPFLKKGTLSAVLPGPPRALYVDAINNEGFSGAPLYYFRRQNPQEPVIAGVVSKYKIEHEVVLDEAGERTDKKVAYNTGFLIAYDVAGAIELAKSAV